MAKTKVADDSFRRARALFPHTRRVVYFNSASYGPFCTPVAEAMRRNIDLRLAADRDDSHDAFTCAESLRRDLAALIGARKQDIGLGLNTSFGLNLAAWGLPLERGDEVLLSEVEFPAGVYSWRGAAEARGLKLTFVPARERRFDIEACRRAITRRTRVLSISWVQFFNGFKNDLPALAELCREHGLYFVVDGIQGMGVEPINVRRLGIDIFTSGCQKWMLSPQGSGFFYVAERVRERLRSSYLTWHAADWKMRYDDLFKYDLPFFSSARRFELGYYAVLNLLGMQAAVELIKGLGIRRIQRHNYALIDRLAAFLNQHPAYQVTSSMDRRHRSSILTFSCARLKELHRHLLKQRFICVRREGSIRISVHLFNNNQDIDRLIQTLDEFADRFPM